MTFGCSYSYGQGLFYEDVYTTKLAKKLNLKNINLSIPGSGLKIQTYNTILFINNFIKKRLPKYVIYQYPHDYRVSFALKNGSDLHLETKTINTGDDYINSEYIKKYFLENEGMKYLQDLLEPLYLNNIWEALNIPVFHITFGDYIQEYKSLHQKFDIINIESDSTKLDYYELARDLSHNGRKFHDKVYKTLLNKIKNGKISILFDFKSSFAIVSIVDNGTGIVKSDISQITEPYFTTKEGGTGLGLAITKKIIEDHNGTMLIKSSKKQKQTSVIFQFPLTK